MLLKTKVKVGNITNLSDARYCAGMGVDLLGFPIGNGPNQITPEVFQEIAEWVSGPQFVFECTDTIDDEMVAKVTLMASIQHIQVTYDQLVRLAGKLNDKSVILVTDENKWPTISEDTSINSVSHVILEGTSSIKWKVVERINNHVPVLIPYARIENESQEISSLPMAGIVLEGSSEAKPGHKDYDHLSSVLELLEVD